MARTTRQTSPTDSAVEDDERQYGNGPESKEELDAKYPNRPRNHHETPEFSVLLEYLFDPLNENKTQPGHARNPRMKKKVNPKEERRKVITSFIARWREKVGDDFYPAMRLICPDQDRERGMYGLKELAIGKLLVKVLGINKESGPAQSLLKWKLPGQNHASRTAGDFAGRCYDVLEEREMQRTGGGMRIGEVNELLDKLADASGEKEQLPIITTFYRSMNAKEMMWLIRIILKQMKVGATEKTFLELWHPNAYALFNVSSSLRHVCWELSDPNVSLTTDETGLTLMQCFQPQLAQFQEAGGGSFDKILKKLGVTENNPEFYIEEKLDGERIQMHMVEDSSTPGGYKFSFWSRKGKDYTYLYGESFGDENSSLTRHIRDAFNENTANCILDGEMIAWDPAVGKMVAFGTLKTSALSAQKNPFDLQGWRPLFRVFDMLYVNGNDLTSYPLEKRRAALAAGVTSVKGRLEIHPFRIARGVNEIQPELEKIVLEASEGLVLKNPLSVYHLSARHNHWIKIKPEYMSELGEELDCVVIGGYYGQGRRGNYLASFLCGLRVSADHIRAGANREKCRSFFKVGGGFRSQDYAEIRHHTDGKWKDWNPKAPPSEYIELAGRASQFERPDQWIRPKDSLVISVKATSIDPSISFAVGQTLRFPRFRKLRYDRSWDSALDEDDFANLKKKVEEDIGTKMELEDRRRRSTKRAKTELTVSGDGSDMPFKLDDKSKIFKGLTFFVPCGSDNPDKTKNELDAIIAQHGGNIVQTPDTDPANGMILVADKFALQVRSLFTKTKDKKGRNVNEAKEVNIIKPKWIFDCLSLGDEDFLLPYEPGHIYYPAPPKNEEQAESMKECPSVALESLAGQSCDQFGDPYCRNINVDELQDIFKGMPKVEPGTFNKDEFLDELETRGRMLPQLHSLIFRRCCVHFAAAKGVSELAKYIFQNYVKFGGGEVVEDLDEKTTHVVVVGKDEGAKDVARQVRKQIASRPEIPHVVTEGWIEECWTEKTRVDEGSYISNPW